MVAATFGWKSRTLSHFYHQNMVPVNETEAKMVATIFRLKAVTLYQVLP